ncbi:MAG: hypothetical protein HLUCCA12_03120 [Rhodobacteraceae bacterium HLUCCA12]|nr:MAG: hypothetical protein HLUCCA12_03120 [Rhodobacteraceae bacterium HLUCCA12]
MRHFLRPNLKNDERAVLLGDALGALALFVLLLAALHLPVLT